MESLDQLLESDMLLELEHYPDDEILQKCYECEESKTEKSMVWHRGLGLDTLIEHYEEHAKMKHFATQIDRIANTTNPTARSRYLPWSENYAEEIFKEEIKKYLHPQFSKIKKRVEAIYRTRLGLSSPSDSDMATNESATPESETETSETTSEFSSPSDKENLGFQPQSKPAQPNPEPDDELSAFTKNFLETEEEKRKRKLENPPNPCKDGGKYCTRYPTFRDAQNHYRLYHDTKYRSECCTREPSCGRKFHDQATEQRHKCDADKLEYLSPRKSVHPSEFTLNDGSSQRSPSRKQPFAKRQLSPLSTGKRKILSKKKKKKHTSRIINESSDSDINIDEDDEAKELIALAKSNQERKKSQPPASDVAAIDLTELQNDFDLEDLTSESGFGTTVAGTIRTQFDDRYRFCPICSMPKIEKHLFRTHVDKCLIQCSKVYNTLVHGSR